MRNVIFIGLDKAEEVGALGSNVLFFEHKKKRHAYGMRWKKDLKA